MDTESAADPLTLVENLSSADIARRLDILAAQEQALRTLLRAARARERAADRKYAKEGTPCRH
jgi:hypothetical protein